MPANEIQNRYAAGFWLTANGGGGEVPANWIPGSLTVHSGLSIRDDFIISSTPNRNPMVIMRFDRVFERARTVINHNFIVTIDDTRFSLPVNIVNQGVPADYTWEQARVAVQPMMVEWMGPGPDYSSPLWLPFNLGYAGASTTLPAQFNEDVYDAVAVMFPNLFDVTPEPTTTWATSVCVNVFEVPPLEVQAFSVNNTLPSFPAP